MGELLPVSDGKLAEATLPSIDISGDGATAEPQTIELWLLEIECGLEAADSPIRGAFL